MKRLEDTVTASLRVARGGRTPRRRIDLYPVLRSAVQGAEGAFNERGGTIAPVEVGGVPVWVLGDAMALEQLFLNLLLNSAQAVERGGHATITLEVVGPDVCVAVTDTGAGIPMENLEHVVDLFFSTREGGTGLGLAVARQTAAAHGGSLTIASVVGEGTRVEVRLPLVVAPTAGA